MDEQTEINKLVDKARELDREAFGRIFDIYYERVYKFVYYKVGNITEAEDLAAQTFAGALKTIANFKWKGSAFTSWLFRIANNVVVDYYRQQNRPVNEPIDDHLELAGDGDTAEAAIENLQLNGARYAIDQLPAEQRQAIILRFIAELTLEETALAMKKSVGAVKSLQFRALENLRRLLGGDYS